MLRVRSSSPSGRVVDIDWTTVAMVNGLVATPLRSFLCTTAPRLGYSARRFPPPWSVDEQPACFIVRDHNGQALSYVWSGPIRSPDASLGLNEVR